MFYTDIDKSNLFKKAHAMTRYIIQKGDDYRVTFSSCLKYLKTFNTYHVTVIPNAVTWANILERHGYAKYWWFGTKHKMYRFYLDKQIFGLRLGKVYIDICSGAFVVETSDILYARRIYKHMKSIVQNCLYANELIGA